MKDISLLDSDQLDAIDFIVEGEDTLLCADIGTGKTVICLTAMMRKLHSHDIGRWLVVAPPLVAIDTWPKEVGEWKHFQNGAITVECATGLSALERQRVIAGDADVVAINYENLVWLFDSYPSMPFDGIVFDEIDKLKSVSTKRFKNIRNKIKQFKSRIGMTATLLPNFLTELWGQVYLVDGGETFGKSFYKWRAEYFYPTDFKQYKWAPFPGTAEKLADAIKDITFRLKEKGMPELVLLPSVKLSMPVESRLKYDEMERHYLANVDVQEVVHTVLASSTAVQVGKLQQLSAGFIYIEKTPGDKKPVWITDMKIKWAANLCRLFKEQNKQIVMFYHYQAEFDALKEYVPDIRSLKSTNPDNAETIQLWNEGKLPYVALHPASAGHGLNLQKSGAYNIGFLTRLWSGGLFRQVIGRLRRRGQKEQKIFVHTAIFENTVDEKVSNVVEEKGRNLDNFNWLLEASNE